MAAYNGGRRPGAVNFSNYMQDLNQILPQEKSPKDDGNDDDLAMFTNVQFIDDFSARGAGNDREPQSATTATTASTLSTDPVAPASAVGDFDFNMSDDFNNFDFGAYNVPNFPDALGNLQNLQPNTASAYPPSAAQQGPFEEQSRVAAEEDKRRRNTAASARFRVKKKAREQALEKREKELGEEVTQLKNRITHLETENKWLRGLVMEKTGSKDSKFDPKLAAALKVLGKESDDEDDDKRSRTRAEHAGVKADRA